MLARIVSRRYVFTAAGDHGAVSVYDNAGRKLVDGLGSIRAAEAWCDRRTQMMPERALLVAPQGAPSGRNRVTGY